MSDGLVQILDGNTFVVSDARGDIEASPTEPTGLFSFDTRFLSKWVLTINGERMNALSVDDLQYFETRFFLVPGTGTVYVDAKLSVIRRRAVGDGFHEELTILNHADEPVDLTVRIEAGSDFADLFEVKDALEKKGTYYRARRRRQAGTRLRPRHLPAARRRSRPPRQREVDENGLTFTLRVAAARRSGRTELEVVTAIARTAGTSADRHRGARTRPATAACSRTSSGGSRRRPRLECDWDPLQATYRRSLVDLAALRFSPLDRRWPQPARRGPAVVHDHVRPGQHPHEPAGAAVRAGARGDDAACARRLAGQSASTTSATRTPAGSSTRCAMAS